MAYPLERMPAGWDARAGVAVSWNGFTYMRRECWVIEVRPSLGQCGRDAKSQAHP